jgi:hypothetical protein
MAGEAEVSFERADLVAAVKWVGLIFAFEKQVSMSRERFNWSRPIADAVPGEPAAKHRKVAKQRDRVHKPSLSVVKASVYAVTTR